MKKFNFLLPWIALIVSILSAYYSWSGIQVANESNEIAKDIQESTKNIFLAEKRPYLNVYISEISPGNYLNINNGNEPTALFTVELKNEGGIPARNIETIIYYFDDEQKTYNTLRMYVPDTQKILPGKFHSMDISMSDKEGTPMNRAIKSKELRFQVVVNYRSDVDKSTEYKTKKQFFVRSDGVTLIGNLGEFQ